MSTEPVDLLNSLWDSLTILNVVTAATAALVSFAVLEYTTLRRKSKQLPGPSFTPPFLGTIVEMVKRPFQYYEAQQKFGPMSWNCLLGQFVIFIADAKLAKKVFQNCSAGSNDFKLSMTLGGNRIFGKNNLIYMPAQVHKAVRKRFLHLFTRRALKVYLEIQERIVRKYLTRFATAGEPGQPARICVRTMARDMNIETSTEVFVGPYVGEEMRASFAELYFCMNEGFLALPLYWPGTTLWKAVQAKNKLVSWIEGFVRQSKAKMALPGATPECLLDVWMEAESTRREADESDEDKMHRDDHSIACLLLDFLFAAQDASTSSIVWAVALLCEHPDVLRRVREEQAQLRPNNGNVDPDLADKMTYTRQVTREVLRYRPPATMVPHETVRDTPITSDYSIPKGTIVLPSIWAAHFTDFPNSDQFNPDRFSEPKKEDDALGSSFLAFGAGPHMCPGREYAMNHLTMFIALFSTSVDVKRIRTPTSDNIIFGPTIYPEDGCSVEMKPANLAQ